LEKLIKPFKGMGYHTFFHNDGVLDPSETKNNSIMIFDDVACEKQDNIRSFFVWVDTKISTHDVACEKQDNIRSYFCIF